MALKLPRPGDDRSPQAPHAEPLALYPAGPWLAVGGLPGDGKFGVWGTFRNSQPASGFAPTRLCSLGFGTELHAAVHATFPVGRRRKTPKCKTLQPTGIREDVVGKPTVRSGTWRKPENPQEGAFKALHRLE